MKKIIALLLALTLVLTMVGCGGKKEYLAGTVSDTGVVAIGVPGQPANTDRPCTMAAWRPAPCWACCTRD